MQNWDSLWDQKNKWQKQEHYYFLNKINGFSRKKLI